MGGVTVPENGLRELVRAWNRQRHWINLQLVIELLGLQVLLRSHDHVPRNFHTGIAGLAAHNCSHRAFCDAHPLIDIRARSSDAPKHVDMFLYIWVDAFGAHIQAGAAAFGPDYQIANVAIKAIGILAAVTRK